MYSAGRTRFKCLNPAVGSGPSPWTHWNHLGKLSCSVQSTWCFANPIPRTEKHDNPTPPPIPGSFEQRIQVRCGPVRDKILIEKYGPLAKERSFRTPLSLVNPDRPQLLVTVHPHDPAALSIVAMQRHEVSSSLTCWHHTTPAVSPLAPCGNQPVGDAHSAQLVAVSCKRAATSFTSAGILGVSSSTMASRMFSQVGW